MKKIIVFFVVLAIISSIMFAMDEPSQYGYPSLYIYNWTYYIPDSIIDKFEKEFGVTVIYDEFSSVEEMYAKLKEGKKNYDIVFPSGDYTSILIKENMLEKIDKSKFSNIGNIDPAILQKTTFDLDMEYSVPYYLGAVGIAVNTAKVPDFERSWSIFSRTDLHGRMSMLDDMREVMGGALTFLGYSANTQNLNEITAAKDLIAFSWKPNLSRFDSESYLWRYPNGDLWVVHGYGEVIFEGLLYDKPDLIKDTVFFIPNEGGTAYLDSMCIPKGAKNIDLAHAFINFIHRPEIYAKFVDEFGLPSAVNIPARHYKTGNSWYSVNDLVNTEIITDIPDNALDLYKDAWFNSIRVEN